MLRGWIITKEVRNLEDMKRAFRVYMELDISKTAIRTYLKSIGFVYRKSRYVPLLDDKHKAGRLAFCTRHQNHYWENVIFSDETTLISHLETVSRKEHGLRKITHPILSLLLQGLQLN